LSNINELAAVVVKLPDTGVVVPPPEEEFPEAPMESTPSYVIAPSTALELAASVATTLAVPTNGFCRTQTELVLLVLAFMFSPMFVSETPLNVTALTILAFDVLTPAPNTNI
jgi:hypothetical protein